MGCYCTAKGVYFESAKSKKSADWAGKGGVMNETEFKIRIKFFFLLTFNMFPDKQREKREMSITLRSGGAWSIGRHPRNHFFLNYGMSYSLEPALHCHHMWANNSI